jgi:hypothetical protein
VIFDITVVIIILLRQRIASGLSARRKSDVETVRSQEMKLKNTGVVNVGSTRRTHFGVRIYPILIAVCFGRLLSGTSLFAQAIPHAVEPAFAPVDSGVSGLIGEGISLFCPKDFDPKSIVPGLALVEQPVIRESLPASWSLHPMFSSNGRPRVPIFTAEARSPVRCGATGRPSNYGILIT